MFTGDITNLIGELPGVTGPAYLIAYKLHGDVTKIKGMIPRSTGPTGLHGDLSNIVGYIYSNGNPDLGQPTLYGDLSKLSGEVTHLTGDATNIYGDASGVTGNLDLCGITGLGRNSATPIALSSLIWS